MVQAIERLHHALLLAERAAIVFLLTATVGFVLTQVVTRYVVARPPVWTEEAARYSLIWLVFVGAAYLSGHVSLMRVTLFDDRFPRPLLRIAEILAHLIILAVAATLLVLSLDYLDTVRSQRSAALGVSMFWVYIASVIGYGLVAVHSLFHVMELLLGREKGSARAGITLEAGETT